MQAQFSLAVMSFSGPQGFSTKSYGTVSKTQQPVLINSNPIPVHLTKLSTEGGSPRTIYTIVALLSIRLLLGRDRTQRSRLKYCISLMIKCTLSLLLVVAIKSSASSMVQRNFVGHDKEDIDITFSNITVKINQQTILHGVSGR